MADCKSARSSSGGLIIVEGDVKRRLRRSEGERQGGEGGGRADGEDSEDEGGQRMVQETQGSPQLKRTMYTSHTHSNNYTPPSSRLRSLSLTQAIQTPIHYYINAGLLVYSRYSQLSVVHY